MIKSYRSHSAESQDKHELAREKEKLANMENQRRMMGGGKSHHGYMGGGVSDSELEEQRNYVSRKESDEKMYERDK